ncbi:MAG TPA: dicarboxylate/amino acid:cation symporter [Gemmatimonadaceae bacterium]|nr:dicarboxylate/amino acid:cation symporter [Gemmatimonadaceae bacterium]
MNSPTSPRGPRLPLAAQVLLGLILGFALGMLLARAGEQATRTGIAIAEPIGALFVNAIRMTVIPLVVASLVVAVATAPDPRVVGAIGARALILFVAILLAGAAFAALLAPPLLALSPMRPEVADALRATTSTGTAGAAAASPSFGQWLVDLVPANPFKAASDGAMLPLIVFALALGFALPRIDPTRGAPVIRFFEGISDAMILLVRWILAFAPLGVFALAIPLAIRAGGSAAGALVSYILVSVVLTTAFAVLVLYPLGAVGGRVSLSRFARACLPPQAVAFGSRSSLAALPAMIETARDRLALPPAITGFFLPLSTATFRAGSAVHQTIAVLFVAYLFGVPLGAAQLATIAVTVALTTFSVPAIPGGSILVLVPVLVAAHVPAEGIGVLLGVDTIPDMFRTTVNVTGHMTVASVLGRGDARSGEPAIRDAR